MIKTLSLYYIVHSRNDEIEYHSGPFASWVDAHDSKATDLACRYEPYKFEIVQHKIDVDVQ